MRRMLACFVAAIVLGGVLEVAAGAAAAADPTRQALLARAAEYVSLFVDRFSNAVAEERYVQDWKTNAGMTLLHRELVSDFLLTRVSSASPWLAYRDVF